MLCNNHSQRQRKCRRREQCANMDAKCVLRECIHVCTLYTVHIYVCITHITCVFHTCIQVAVCISHMYSCVRMYSCTVETRGVWSNASNGSKSWLHCPPSNTWPETQFSKVKLFLPSSCASSIKNSSPCGNFWKIFFRSKLFSLPWIQLSPHCGKLMRIKIILTP